MKKLPYDPVFDFAPVSSVGTVPNVSSCIPACPRRK